jgi:type I restriction enzyme S subunit
MKPADATKPALTPKLRFPEFLNSGPWTEKPLYEAVSPVVREKQKPDVLYKGLGVRSHGKGTFTKENADPEKNAMECLYEVKPHDLVANITFAWEGAVAIVKPEDDGALVSHRFPTYVFNREVAIPEFFQYVISNKKFTYDLGVISPGGAGRNRVLNKNDFLKLRPPIPDVAEQKKIAECLSTLDELIGAESQKLDALKAHKKGLMQQLFPREGETLPRLRFPEFHSAPEWGMVPLGNIAEIKLGKMLDGRKHTTGRLLPYVNNIAVRWNAVDTSNLPKMYFDDHELDRFGLKAGDVVVCEGGEPGRAAVWDGRLPDLKFQKAVHRVRFNVSFEPHLLVQYLEAIAGTPQFEKFFTGGGIKHLTREAFSKLEVPLITEAEQHRIATCLSSLDDLIAAQSDRLAALQTHKQGLLQQLFPSPAETEA